MSKMWCVCVCYRFVVVVVIVFFCWWTFNVMFSFSRRSWHIIMRSCVQTNLTFVSNNQNVVYKRREKNEQKPKLLNEKQCVCIYNFHYLITYMSFNEHFTTWTRIIWWKGRQKSYCELNTAAAAAAITVVFVDIIIENGIKYWKIQTMACMYTNIFWFEGCVSVNFIIIFGSLFVSGLVKQYLILTNFVRVCQLVLLNWKIGTNIIMISLWNSSYWNSISIWLLF